jgi:hypothetical protein
MSAAAVAAGCGSSSSGYRVAPTTTSTGGAGSQSSSLVVFRTSANDVHCGSYAPSRAVAAYLRCNVLGGMRPLPPGRCRAGDPGLGVDMFARGRSEAPCFGDPGPDAGFAQHHPFVLRYGQTWRRDGFSCRSSSSGLVCHNLSGHGFSLRGHRWRLF